MYTSKRSFRPNLELLEDRTVPYALAGTSWANTTVTASFLPDGTSSEGYTSSLFSTLDSDAPRVTWQSEFARALQTWANVSNLNFYFVGDDGSPTGTSGQVQGDPRFGDIRLGAHDLSNGYVGYSYYPSSSSTKGGDITISPAYTYHIGSNIDLYSVLLHESGHSLGLDHSTLSSAVMYPTIMGVYSGLSADDIAGIQAIYGARKQDSYDTAAPNNTLSSASTISLTSGAISFKADLTSLSDVDYYKVTAPSTTDGTLTVTMDTRLTSLLTPKLSVYDAMGNLLGSASGTTYTTAATVQLSGLTAGQTYYVMADGATSDAFGMGAYSLQISFGGTGTPPPSSPSPDRFESNNTLQTATNLGKINSVTQTGLNLDSSTDVDYFKFVARSSANYQITVLYTYAQGNIDLAVYNSSGTLISSSTTQTDNESVTVGLVAGQQYYVKVFSSTGAENTYDLGIAKLGSGGTGTKGGKGGKAAGALVEGDGTPLSESGRLDLLRYTFQSAPETLNALLSYVEWDATPGFARKGH